MALVALTMLAQIDQILYSAALQPQAVVQGLPTEEPLGMAVLAAVGVMPLQIRLHMARMVRVMLAVTALQATPTITPALAVVALVA